MKSSAADEQAFLASILQQVDDINGPPRPTSRSLHSPPKDRTPSGTQAPAEDFDMESFLEGSEHWDLDDYTLTPVKPPAPKFIPPQPIPYTPETCTRVVVDSVSELCMNSRWRKCVSATVASDQEPVTIYLQDDWYYTDIQPGDICNVIGNLGPPTESTSNAASRRCISITTQNNLLILHPDILLTATALSNASQCRRKPMISSLIRSNTDTTPSLVWGSMLHEVMQRCLLEENRTDKFLDRSIDEVVLAGLGDLVKIGLDENVARREVKDRAKGLKLFAEKYLHDEPQANGTLDNTRSGNRDIPSLLAISKVLDIEEDIWSPTYGLKGKLDATVQALVSDPAPSTGFVASQNSANRTLTSAPLPLELKTGRAVAGMEHRAQTMLYTLLLTERYGVDVQDGLLFYTQNEQGQISRVPRGRHELRGLLTARNEIAAYMWRRIRAAESGKRHRQADNMVEHHTADGSTAIQPFLPPPIDDERACVRCYVRDTCFLFRKTHPDHYNPISLSNTEDLAFDPPVPSFLKDVFDERTGHLTPSQTKFFRDWEHLLSLEEQDMVRFKRELWTMGAAEREKKGRCFGGMVLVQNPRKRNSPSFATEATSYASTNDISSNGGKDAKIHKFTYTFRRSGRWSSPLTPAPSLSIIPTSPSAHDPVSTSQRRVENLLNGHLNVGDPITVSAEPLLALARGYILELTPEEVVLGVDHVLDVDAIRNRLHNDDSISRRLFTTSQAEVIFRIDKDELFGGMTRVRNNLINLFYADGDRRRLQLVVDLKQPTFSEPTPPFRRSPKSNLNDCQVAAMKKVLAAEDYALLLGMPGTGKTTVVAALIRELVGRGKTVLLTSYTHSAVDTILMKLSEEDQKDSEGARFGILRVGNLDKVHPDVRKYTLNARKQATSLEEYERQIMSPPVVATTCLSIEHPLFSRRKFDYCIVDEASQITLPTCLGPLRYADTFVLVGDHYQLPPLVKNPQARKGGLDISLFRRLSEAHPAAIVDLNLQYRMNADIMLLSNHLIYDNRLRCGSEEVAKRCLALNDFKFLKSFHANGNRGTCGPVCWLQYLISPKVKAVFVDTDNLPAHDSRIGDLVQNTVEAQLVQQFVETLLRSGVEESQVGVISLYRQQVKFLQNLFERRPGVEVLTADRSQGRDKDVIVISLVRSNDAGQVGDLMKDWRRMNVSFTRAKRKLVLFGSRKTLQAEPLLAQFFELMESKGWILQLPAGAHQAHAPLFSTSGNSNSVPEPASPIRIAPKRKPIGKENNIRPIVSNVKFEEPRRPTKKLKTGWKDGAEKGDAGVLKGRPVLRDLIGGDV